MEAQYDDKGNYIYPEGFDPDTQEWLPGYDAQREAWEKRYAAARERFEAHRKQLADAQKADAEAAAEAGEATSYVVRRCREQRHARHRTKRWPHCGRSWPVAEAPRCATQGVITRAGGSIDRSTGAVGFGVVRHLDGRGWHRSDVGTVWLCEWD